LRQLLRRSDEALAEVSTSTPGHFPACIWLQTASIGNLAEAGISANGEVGLK
jgi:hypothetical protein